METVYLIAGMFFVTFSIRYGLLPLSGRIRFSPGMQRALSYVPPAVLTAIITPELFLHSGSIDLSLGNHRLIAGILATVVAWRTKNVVLTILVGMAALLLLGYFT